MSNNPMKIFMAFIAIMLIAFFAIGFTSSVQAPTNATALAQYDNLTKATGIASTGMTSVFLILIIALVLSAVFFLSRMVKKR